VVGCVVFHHIIIPIRIEKGGWRHIPTHVVFCAAIAMKNIISAFIFFLGLGLGLIGGAALLAYAYQAAGLYPPDDATIKFIARERGWLRDDV
jgi:hypothetical protein